MGAKTGQKGNQSVHFLSTWSSSFIHMMVLREHKTHILLYFVFLLTKTTFFTTALYL